MSYYDRLLQAIRQGQTPSPRGPDLELPIANQPYPANPPNVYFRPSPNTMMPQGSFQPALNTLQASYPGIYGPPQLQSMHPHRDDMPYQPRTQAQLYAQWQFQQRQQAQRSPLPPQQQYAHRHYLQPTGPLQRRPRAPDPQPPRPKSPAARMQQNAPSGAQLQTPLQAPLSEAEAPRESLRLLPERPSLEDELFEFEDCMDIEFDMLPQGPLPLHKSFRVFPQPYNFAVGGETEGELGIVCGGDGELKEGQDAAESINAQLLVSGGVEDPELYERIRENPNAHLRDDVWWEGGCDLENLRWVVETADWKALCLSG